MNRRSFLALVAGGLAGAATRGAWSADVLDETEVLIDEMIAAADEVWVNVPTQIIVPEQLREIAFSVLEDGESWSVRDDLTDPDAWFLVE